jgi:hypothetical protein
VRRGQAAVMREEAASERGLLHRAP